MHAWHQRGMGVIAWLCVAACAGAAPAELPMEFQGGLIWMQVRADSSPRPLHFLLDSGANVSVLNRRTARDLGLQSGPRITLSGVGTRTTGHGPVPWHAWAGPIELPTEYLILDLSRLAQACGRPLDGLLGATFFHDRIVEIDYRAQRLRIHDTHPETHSVQAVPMGVSSRGFSVQACINGTGNQRVRVDTGCASALQWVSSTTSGRACPGPPAVGLATLSIPQTMTGVRLGPHVLDTVPTGLHRHPIFPGESGLLGNGILALFGTVTFDSRAGRLHLGGSNVE